MLPTVTPADVEALRLVIATMGGLIVGVVVGFIIRGQG